MYASIDLGSGWPTGGFLPPTRRSGPYHALFGSVNESERERGGGGEGVGLAEGAIGQLRIAPHEELLHAADVGGGLPSGESASGRRHGVWSAVVAGQSPVERIEGSPHPLQVASAEGDVRA